MFVIVLFVLCVVVVRVCCLVVGFVCFVLVCVAVCCCGLIGV